MHVEEMSLNGGGLALTAANADKNILFNAADEKLLHFLKERIQQKLPSFLSPLNMVIDESVAVAYYLNEIINKFGPGTLRKTFFCNSYMEAVHGAIKLARHYTRKKDHQYNGNVLLYDPSDYYKQYFNPGNKSVQEALIPGVKTVTGIDNLLHQLGGSQFRITIVSLYELPGREYQSFCQYCDDNGIIKILDISRIKTLNREAVERSLIDRFEIVCWGEGLTSHQLPFGAFSAAAHIHEPWNSIKDCGLHSTTFGGNGTVLAWARENLEAFFPLFLTIERHRQFIKELRRSVQMKRKGYRRYLNASVPLLFGSALINLDFCKADGSWLYARTAGGRLKKKLDCNGSAGCNVHGHNNEMLIADVLEPHDASQDYCRQLARQLTEITGLEKMFPAVSGASAVEIALVLSYLATGAKKKILIFQGNFAGKTLVALNATAGNHYFFQPLFSQVTVFNYQKSGAAEELKALLTSGETGLVWMEYMQGRSMVPIPAGLMAMVDQYRDRYQYLVGVDEILNGIHRSGPFTSYEGIIKPDIVTFAKGLSGMLLPMAVTMVTGRVYNKVKEQHASIADQLEKMYRNQLTAHIALHMLHSLQTGDIPKNIAGISLYLQSALNEMPNTSRYIDKFELHGLHVQYKPNLRRFPFKYFGPERSFFVLTNLFYRKGNFLSVFGRLLPPLNMSKEEAAALVQGIKRVLGLHPLHFFWTGLRQMAYVYFMRRFHKIFKQ